MEYSKKGAVLEVSDVVVRSHSLQDLREQKRFLQYEIDTLQAKKAEVQVLIDEAKRLGVEEEEVIQVTP